MTADHVCICFEYMNQCDKNVFFFLIRCWDFQEVPSLKEAIYLLLVKLYRFYGHLYFGKIMCNTKEWYSIDFPVWTNLNFSFYSISHLEICMYAYMHKCIPYAWGEQLLISKIRTKFGIEKTVQLHTIDIL